MTRKGMASLKRERSIIEKVSSTPVRIERLAGGVYKTYILRGPQRKRQKISISPKRVSRRRTAWRRRLRRTGRTGHVNRASGAQVQVHDFNGLEQGNVNTIDNDVEMMSLQQPPDSPSTTCTMEWSPTLPLIPLPDVQEPVFNTISHASEDASVSAQGQNTKSRHLEAYRNYLDYLYAQNRLALEAYYSSLD